MRHSSRPIRGTKEKEKRVVVVSCIMTSLCTRRFLLCFRRRNSRLSVLFVSTLAALPTIGRHKSRARRKKRPFWAARPFEHGGSQERCGKERERERGRRVDDVCFAVVDISVLSVLNPSLSLSRSLSFSPSCVI